LELMRHAAELDDRRIEQVFAVGSEDQRLLYLGSILTELQAFLSLLRAHFLDSREAAWTGLDLVLRRKALAVAVLIAQRHHVMSGRYPDLAIRMQEITELQRKIARITLAGTAGRGTQVSRQTLAQLYLEKDQLEKELGGSVPELTLNWAMLAADRGTVALN